MCSSIYDSWFKTILHSFILSRLLHRLIGRISSIHNEFRFSGAFVDPPSRCRGKAVSVCLHSRLSVPTCLTVAFYPSSLSLLRNNSTFSFPIAICVSLRVSFWPLTQASDDRTVSLQFCSLCGFHFVFI